MTNGQDGRWKILIADDEFADTVPEIAAGFPSLDIVSATPENDAQSLASEEFAGMVVQSAPIQTPLLDAMTGLKVLLKMGRNYENVEVGAVRARELTFACTPRKGPNCVAELALTFILALSKDLLVSHSSVAEGAYRHRGLKPEITAQWKMAFHWMHNTRVHEIQDKTLGIVGMGEIGCELARRTAVLGMRNVYFKRRPLSEELEQLFSASYLDLDELLAASDYVCLAVPHTTETERMIGKKQLSVMQESAFLVNICRGGVVDEDALIEALTENRLAGAGLDVFTYEPLAAESPLSTLDNVILTPHIGGGTGTNRGLELSAALTEMDLILAGGHPQVDRTQPG